MLSLHSALAAAVTAAIALLPLAADASRTAQPLVQASASANFGTVAAVDLVREDRVLYQVRVKLDSGESRTLVQQRLNDLRVGDRAAIDGEAVYRHDTRAERIDRWGYWVDAKGNRYDDNGLRVHDGQGD